MALYFFFNNFLHLISNKMQASCSKPPTLSDNHVWIPPKTSVWWVGSPPTNVVVEWLMEAILWSNRRDMLIIHGQPGIIIALLLTLNNISPPTILAIKKLKCNWPCTINISDNAITWTPSYSVTAWGNLCKWSKIKYREIWDTPKALINLQKTSFTLRWKQVLRGRFF